MTPAFKQHEIDHHVLKLIVGIIALSLANLTTFFAGVPLESISESYHEGGWARDFFVGFLFAIGAFLLAYNGECTLEMVLAKVAALAALGVAIFPCQCGRNDEIIPYVHYVSAVVMFLVLACLCGVFYRRAHGKGHRQALWRAWIYATCGVAILGAVAVLVADAMSGGAISDKVHRLVFYGERVGLVAFGVSWLVASRVFPGITTPGERVSLLPFTKNPSPGRMSNL